MRNGMVERPSELVGSTVLLDWSGQRTTLRSDVGWANLGGRKAHLKVEHHPRTMCGRKPVATNVRPGPAAVEDVCAHCVRVRVRYYAMPSG
jgi:hypothetical protein